MARIISITSWWRRMFRDRLHGRSLVAAGLLGALLLCNVAGIPWSRSPDSAKFQVDMLPSWRADWLATAIQGVPELATLRRHMLPTLHLDSVAALEPAVLQSLGISAVIWDVDGTLMRRHGTSVAPELADAFARLCSDHSLRHAILSNCSEQRFVDLATIFPAIPILRVYGGEFGLVVRRRLGGDERWTDDGGNVTQVRTGRLLRKPSVAMVRIALAELGCALPLTALMVGDQYLTDVAPANIAGARTVKVRTIDPHSFPATVRVFQWAERVLYRFSPGKQ